MTQASILNYTENRKTITTTPAQKPRSYQAAETQQHSNPETEASELSKHLHTNSTQEQGYSNTMRQVKGGRDRGKGKSRGRRHFDQQTSNHSILKYFNVST